MSWQDEDRRPPALAFRCRRCSGTFEQLHDEPAAALRSVVATGVPLLTVHECDDLPARGIAECIGEAQPHRTLADMLEARRPALPRVLAG